MPKETVGQWAARQAEKKERKLALWPQLVGYVRWKEKAQESNLGAQLLKEVAKIESEDN